MTTWERIAREAIALLANCGEARLIASHLEARQSDPTKAQLRELLVAEMDAAPQPERPAA